MTTPREVLAARGKPLAELQTYFRQLSFYITNSSQLRAFTLACIRDHQSLAAYALIKENAAKLADDFMLELIGRLLEPLETGYPKLPNDARLDEFVCDMTLLLFYEEFRPTARIQVPEEKLRSRIDNFLVVSLIPGQFPESIERTRSSRELLLLITNPRLKSILQERIPKVVSKYLMQPELFNRRNFLNRGLLVSLAESALCFFGVACEDLLENFDTEAARLPKTSKLRAAIDTFTTVFSKSKPPESLLRDVENNPLTPENLVASRVLMELLARLRAVGVPSEVSAASLGLLRSLLLFQVPRSRWSDLLDRNKPTRSILEAAEAADLLNSEADILKLSESQKSGPALHRRL